MEELHKTHKEVPYGYWTLWVQPALRALSRNRVRQATLPLGKAVAR